MKNLIIVLFVVVAGLSVCQGRTKPSDGICPEKCSPAEFPCHKCCHGWIRGPSGKCHDINECLRKPCPSGATCYNTPGSYICNCPPWYQWDRGTNKCVENNPCLRMFCPRGRICRAIGGSFGCHKVKE